MNVLVPVMVYGRWDVFHVWSLAMRDLIDAYPEHSIKVLCVGSEGSVSSEAARRYGWDYQHAPNSPLGNKAQMRLDYAKEYQADYLLFLGSDDVMGVYTLNHYLKAMEMGVEHIAPYDIFYWVRGRLIYSPGYSHRHLSNRYGEPLAVGRCLKTSFLDRIGWKLWPRDRVIHIDRPAHQTIQRHRPTRYYFTHAGSATMIMDIKSRESVTPFVLRPDHRYLEDILEHHFSPEVCKAIRNL